MKQKTYEIEGDRAVKLFSTEVIPEEETKVVQINIWQNPDALQKQSIIKNQILHLYQVSRMTPGLLKTLSEFECDIHLFDLEQITSANLSFASRYWKSGNVCFHKVHSIVGADDYGFGSIYQYDESSRNTWGAPEPIEPRHVHGQISLPHLQSLDSRSIMCLKLHMHNKTLRLPHLIAETIGVSSLSYLQLFNNVDVEGFDFTLDSKVAELYGQHCEEKHFRRHQ